MADRLAPDAAYLTACRAHGQAILTAHDFKVLDDRACHFVLIEYYL